MYTITVRRRLSDAKEIAMMLRHLDPDGVHETVNDPGGLKEALETAGPDGPDAVILDVELPEFESFDETLLQGGSVRRSGGLSTAAGIIADLPRTNIIFVADENIITEHPEYAVDAFRMHASGFLIVPVTEAELRDEVDHFRVPVARQESNKLHVHCFGNFEVFHGGKTVRFSRSLSKEAFAYMIDRRGAGCTVGEICTVLWENRSADSGLKSQCRVILASLKKDLAAIGEEDAIVKGWNTWSVDPSKISCDYYDYLAGKYDEEDAFRGEYMTQYSWAEMTMGALIQDAEIYRQQSEKSSEKTQAPEARSQY